MTKAPAPTPAPEGPAERPPEDAPARSTRRPSVRRTRAGETHAGSGAGADRAPAGGAETGPETAAATGPSGGEATGDPVPPSFEDSLSALEGIVDALERGDLTLEDSLAAFERGIGLARTCQRALDRAEQRVRILTAGDAEEPSAARLEPFAQLAAPPAPSEPAPSVSDPDAGTAAPPEPDSIFPTAGKRK